MIKRLRSFVLPGIALGMLLFSVYHLLFAAERLPKVSPLVEPPHKALASVICGTGLVEARTENIAIGAAVPGTIMEVSVSQEKVGQQIEKGRPLFRVDDRHLKAQLKVHRASLKSAEAELGKLKQQPRLEDLPPSAAKVKAAEANFQKMKDQFDRSVPLFQRKVIPAEEYTTKKFSLAEAEQKLRQSEAEHALLKAGAWLPDQELAQAAIEVAQANVEQTETEIERCLVRAPVDGQILKIDVRPGEYVSSAPGKALVMLGDLTRLHVRVDIDEQDIPRFSSSAKAAAVPRGTTNLRHELKFVRVEPYVTPKKSLTGDNTERVDTRVLQVLYEIQPGTEKVYVGQQLDVFIE
ncbi:MAG: secretion protein HlyD [Planctomycetaceae bacterium]|nr:secretion protein HlyD [Planctomycetaceae bacterium]